MLPHIDRAFILMDKQQLSSIRRPTTMGHPKTQTMQTADRADHADLADRAD